jgi:hypothetical protein
MADTLDPTDFARAQSALAQALAVAGPILGALQQAGTVFDVIQNAAIHRSALERDVADLLAQADAAKVERGRWDEMTAASMQRATEAEAESKARVDKAASDASATILALHDALSVNIAEAQAEATDKLQSITAHVVAAQAEHDTALQNMAVLKDAAQAEFDTLTKKLDTLKSNAARFAAALQG